MLTKNDLKAIGVVVQTQIDESLVRELTPIKKDIKSLKRSVRKIKKDTNTIIDVFDKRDVRLQKRVKQVEHHLGLETPQN